MVVAATDPTTPRRPQLIVLGIRGVPAAHGGFETFAERLSLWLRDGGWDITVYCQEPPGGMEGEDWWEGVRRVHIPARSGPIGTIDFDTKSVVDAARRPGLILTLGYNTGFLAAYLRFRGRRNVINMDGLEYRRAKYGFGAKTYLWINERIAAWSGTRLIADHPAIEKHLVSRVRANKISMVPYGSDEVSGADPQLLVQFGLSPNGFFTLIARPEPENSILEIVSAFSAKTRGRNLIVLGHYDYDNHYQSEVLNSAGPEVKFLGPIFDKDIIAAIRFHCTAYFHGHQVGGTNPSLVEALGAGNAIIAHDNTFNRWVAGNAGLYFKDFRSIDMHIQELSLSQNLRKTLKTFAKNRWESDFRWPPILMAYETLLRRELDNV